VIKITEPPPQEKLNNGKKQRIKARV